jgi:hypothetical protein
VEKTWHILLHNPLPIKSAAMQLILAMAVLLGGCNGDVPKSDHFATKLVDAIPQIPPTRQLRIRLPSGTFTTIDFMALHGCALQITLGKYQSRLGRYASDSQRLLLDLEYLSHASDCIALKKSEYEVVLAEQLRQENTLKLQQLPSRIFNATLANTEFQQLWNRHSKSATNTEQLPLTLSAITEINASVKRWLSGDYQASNIEFEIQLSEIYKANTGYIQSELLGANLVNLEMQLRAVLPTEYQRWLEVRNTVLQDLHREQD